MVDDVVGLAARRGLIGVQAEGDTAGAEAAGPIEETFERPAMDVANRAAAGSARIAADRRIMRETDIGQRHVCTRPDEQCTAEPGAAATRRGDRGGLARLRIDAPLIVTARAVPAALHGV